MGRLTLLSESLTARLAHQHESIGELCAGLSESQLKNRIHPGKWSCFENIAHLAAYQPLFLGRIERMMTEQGPDFQRYIAEEDPLFFTYLDIPAASLQERLSAERLQIIKRISGLSQKEINRVGRHPKFGAMTVTGWTEFFLLHEAHHLYTIFMLTRELC